MNARRLEVHSEPHPDGRYGLVRILAEDDEVDLPGLEVKWCVASLLPSAG